MKNFAYLLILLSAFVFMQSCVKEEFNTDINAQLSFSTDTIFFDTVFTDVGSTTAYLTIHNPYDDFIKVNSIALGQGASSQYRINVNGTSAPTVQNVEIAPKDSIYVLVEVTVKPNDVNAPFVLKDSLVCNVNGRTQDVKLMAWGQNAHYIDGRYNGIIQTQTWTADKPYLIYNSMLIDSLHTLTIEKGTKIYLHKDSYIIAKGQLLIEGTYEDPVIIKGDRLEESYDDVPHQWGNIILADGSGHHKIKWAKIMNGIIGLQLGSLSSETKPSLEISNSVIAHMSYAGIFSLASSIDAKNCLVANSGFYNMALLVGGSYDFKHCTFANYWQHDKRKEPSVVVSNNFSTEEGQYLGDLVKADFGNCIIYGNEDSELLLSQADGVGFNYKFENSLIKVPEDFDTDPQFFINTLKNKDPKFKDYRTYRFDLDTLSPAKDVGAVSVAQAAELDLDNVSHLSDGSPDLGAYERVE